ncbi:MAG: GNAT family N-acetyltransferase [Maricaulaceae bacterium]
MPDNMPTNTQITSLPLTRTPAHPDAENAIRAAVRGAVSMGTENAVSRLATVEDAEVFLEFLLDPSVSAPIYTLPTTLNIQTVRAFIEDHIAEQARGDGLLFFNFDTEGNFGGYTDLCLWPQWSAGELGGAVHPRRQGQRNGVEGARLGFDWMFEALGLEVICETAALDNIRTGRLLGTLGFHRVGQTTSRREDGTERGSLVWEITRAEWDAVHGPREG